MTTPIPPPGTPEPVALAEVVRAVLVALISVGWLTIDNVAVNAVASVLGVVLSWVLTYLTRKRVTPVDGGR